MIDGIYILIVAAAFALLLAVFVYASWEDFDDQRRSDRLVHRNLQRMAGR